jgi:hypothetical protein
VARFGHAFEIATDQASPFASSSVFDVHTDAHALAASQGQLLPDVLVALNASLS